MNPLSRLLRRFKKRRVRFGLRVPDVEQSTLPSRTTKLLVRVDTDFGPRTVVTGSVTREVASAIASALAKGGVEAAFVDGGVAASVAEIVKRRKPREVLSLPSMEKRR
jgi:hypothetical protein